MATREYTVQRIAPMSAVRTAVSLSGIIGLVGPATMPYQRVLGLMHHITHELAHY